MNRTAINFYAFHTVNPHVYTQLLELARRLRSRGIDRYGIAGLFEVLRYDHTINTGSAQDFKLNNSYRAYYARLLMQCNPELAGLFELRSSDADLEVIA